MLAHAFQQLINGLALGSVYGLIAIGYTMVYGIIGMINFAHGDIYMVSAFIAVTSFTLLAALGVTSVPLALLIVLVVAIALTSAYGWSVERIAYRPLRSAPRLAPLISAIGMSIFLQNMVQVTQGARVKPIPPLLTGGIDLFTHDGVTVSFAYSQMLIIVVTLALMLGFTYLITRTSFGRQQRACEQDRTMTALLGINVDRTISLTFMIGAALAAIDTPSRRLIIRISQNREAEEGARGAQGSGSVTLGSTSRANVQARVWDTRSVRSESGSQMVQTVEGGRAYIQVGRSLAVPMRQTVIGPGGAMINEGVIYRDIGSGFYATPRVNGQRVTLEISQQAESFDRGYGPGSVRPSGFL